MFSFLLPYPLCVAPAPAAQAAPASDLRATVDAWVAAHQRQIVSELLEPLAIPNVAADRANIRRNAEHLRAMLGAARVHGRDPRNGGQSARLRRAGRARRDADGALLLPLRRAAGGPEGVEAAGSLHPGSRPGGGSRRHGGAGDRRPEALRARFAHLRAVRFRRQVADRRALRGARRAEGLRACARPPTCASSSTARKRPARRASSRRSRATGTSCART